MIQTVLVYDAIRVNIGSLPAGQHAGYTTGTGIVPWMPSDLAAHPGVVRIDQSPTGHDTTADIYDVEAGAGTTARCASWAKEALANYRNAIRPGQRSPGIYASQSSVTAVINALISGGVTSGIGLWVANWSLAQAQATAVVAAAAGPFPVIGVQFRDAGTYDVSVFSTEWLHTVSAGPPGAARFGDSGPAVLAAQTRLNAWGAAPPLTADSQFGPAVLAAVQAFQHSCGLTADGIIGPATLAALSKNPITPGQLPAPTALAVDHSRVTLGWHAVTGPGLTGYTAAAYGIDGKEYARTVTPITQPWAVLNGLAPGGTYTIRVWPNGGQVAPEGAQITVTLPS